MSKKKRRGRPKKEGEKKRTRSVRFLPSEIDKIERKWGTVQKWIDVNYNREFGGSYEVIIEKES